MRRALTNQSEERAADYCAVAGLVRPGEWTTYGDIATAVHGRRGLARMVARAAAHDERFPHPHRVLRSDGSVARPGDADRAEAAAARLRSEGVTFDGDRADAARRVHFDELQRRWGARSRLSPRR